MGKGKSHAYPAKPPKATPARRYSGEAAGESPRQPTGAFPELADHQGRAPFSGKQKRVDVWKARREEQYDPFPKNRGGGSY